MKKLITRSAQWIINDIKTDWQAIETIINGDIKHNKVIQELPQYIRQNYKSILKTGWLYFLVLAVAVLVGWNLAAKYYQIECNNEITKITQEIKEQNTFTIGDNTILQIETNKVPTKPTPTPPKIQTRALNTG